MLNKKLLHKINMAPNVAGFGAGSKTFSSPKFDDMSSLQAFLRGSASFDFCFFSNGFLWVGLAFLLKGSAIDKPLAMCC